MLLVARARLRRHWVGIIVVGLVGALGAAGVLATVAGARRTDTAYDRLRTATRAFDGRALILDPDQAAANARVTDIRLLPEIESSTTGRMRVGRRADTQDWISATSRPALDAASSRPQIVRGRSFRIENPDDAVISQATADASHLDIGDRLPIDFYSDRQFADVLDNYFIEPAGDSASLRIVGVTRDPDDASGGTTVLVGPAFLAGSQTTAGFPGVLFRLAPGVSRAEAERAIVGAGQGPADLTWASDTAQTLDNTRTAIAGGLLIAAAVIALAGTIALMQVAARQVDQSAGEHDALLALGLTRGGRIAAATLPGVLAGLVAAVAGVAGAVALSPLFPTGRIKLFEPNPGVAVNVAILGVGTLVVLLVVIGAFALASWRAERRAAHAPRQARPSLLVPRAERWTFGTVTLMGTRFAVERGTGRSSVPVRTSLIGIATGIIGVVAAVTFSASLQGFLSVPAHYGQPWDLSIETLGESGAPARLAADRDVEAAAMVRGIDSVIAGRSTVVSALHHIEGDLTPTLESGRLPESRDEIVLGPKLLAESGRAIGDTVRVEAGVTKRMRIVGTALNIDPQDETFGSTAFVTPVALRDLRGSAAFYNEETVLRFRPGADRDAATRRIKAGIPLGLTNESLPARPAAVANVAELGGIPQMLALVLAAIGAIAVAHAVVLAVRRRRREIAVLAAMGMTASQRAWIVLTMAVTMVVIGLAVGIPVGIVLGTYVWNLMANGLRVEWAATVPMLELIVVTTAAIALTLGVALLPARAASRLRPARILRTG